MKIFSKFIILIVFVFGGILFLGLYDHVKENEKEIANVGMIYKDLPPSIQIHNYIVKYSKLYNIPIDIAFGVAHYETGYNGIFQWKYDPRQTSSANAYGAMQIQVPTANDFSNATIKKNDLLVDLELNVKLSMKILAYLKNKYGNWDLALGAYNTGRPLVNQYAKDIANFDATNTFYGN